MKEQNSMDKLFSDGLQNIQVEYNQEEVWDNIQKNKKKRRWIIWVWFMGAIFLVVLLSRAFFERTTIPRENEQNISSIVLDESAKTKTKVIETRNDSDFDVSESLSENESGKVNLSKEEDLLLTKENKEQKKNKKLKLKRTDLSDLNSSNLILQMYGDILKEGAANTSFDHVENSTSKGVKTKLKNDSGNDVLTSSFSSKDNIDVGFLALGDFGRLYSESNIIITEIESEQLIKLDRLEDKAESKFSIFYNGSIFNTDTKFVSTENESQAELENEANQDMFAYSNQILGAYRVNDLFSFSVGLEQLQIFQKFYWDDIEAETGQVFSENAFFIEDDGNSRMIGDSTLGVSSMKKVRQSQQVFTLYSVPLGVLIHRDMNQWSFGSSIEGVVNFHHSFSGFIFNEEANDIEKKQRDIDFYRNDISMSLAIRPYIEYKINEKFRINLHANMRWNASREVSSEVSKDLKIQSKMLGAGIGLSYKFRRK